MIKPVRFSQGAARKIRDVVKRVESMPVTVQPGQDWQPGILRPFAAKITASSQTATGVWSYTVQRVTSWGSTDGVDITGVKNSMETTGTVPFTHGTGMTVSSSSSSKYWVGASCSILPIGSGTIVMVNVSVLDNTPVFWFALPNSAG